MIYPEILLEKRNEHGRLLFFVKATVERDYIIEDADDRLFIYRWKVSSSLPLNSLSEEISRILKKIQGEEENEININDFLINGDKSYLLPEDDVKQLIKELVDEIYNNKKFHPVFLPDFLIDPLGNFKDLYLHEELIPQIKARQGASATNLSIEEIAEYIIEESIQIHPLILYNDDSNLDWAISVISLFGFNNQSQVYMETNTKEILPRVKDVICINYLLDNPILKYGVIFKTENDDQNTVLSDKYGNPVEREIILIFEEIEDDIKIIGFIRNENAQKTYYD